MEKFIVTKSHGDNCTIVQEETNHDTKNLCLMILDLLSHEMLQGEEIMQLTIPISSAHTNHDIDSLANLLTHTPLPEIEEKVESLVWHSHFSQISLILALKDWIKHELIPQHLCSGILS